MAFLPCNKITVPSQRGAMHYVTTYHFPCPNMYAAPHAQRSKKLKKKEEEFFDPPG